MPLREHRIVFFVGEQRTLVQQNLPRTGKRRGNRHKREKNDLKVESRVLIKCLRFCAPNPVRRTLCNRERKMKHPFFRWPHLLFAMKRTPILASRTNSFLLCIAMVSYFQRALLTQSFYICLRFMLLWTPNDVGRLKSDFQHNIIFEANEISRATAAAVFSRLNESILLFFPPHSHSRRWKVERR